jgi:hypothetical protein
MSEWEDDIGNPFIWSSGHFVIRPFSFGHLVIYYVTIGQLQRRRRAGRGWLRGYGSRTPSCETL